MTLTTELCTSPALCSVTLCFLYVCSECMIHAYMDRVSKNTERIQADASTFPSP